MPATTVHDSIKEGLFDTKISNILDSTFYNLTETIIVKKVINIR